MSDWGASNRSIAWREITIRGGRIISRPIKLIIYDLMTLFFLGARYYVSLSRADGSVVKSAVWG